MADTCFVEDLNTLPEQVQLNKENIKKLSDSSTTQAEQLQTLTTKIDTNTANIATNTESIDSIKQSYLLKTDASNTYLTKTDASNTYLTKTDASNTYVMDYDYFDAVLTPSGFEKLQANANIGTSITLFKDTDFTEEIYNIDLKHKTAIFNLYRNDENIYISINIKLDIGRTTSYYSDNDQPSSWYTGIGVIKLGSAAVSGNNYLCYIAYDTTTYNNGLIITPIKKLN